jgi:N-acetylmuramoyl-L-alanine amidase
VILNWTKFILIIFLVFFSCAPRPYYVKPSDWETEELRDSTIQYFSQFLIGRRIFIDPGHGGEHRGGEGIKGKVIEANLNLKVALYLREYLTKAGAIVFMSRDKDVTVTLEERVKMAERSGAEIFISIHHNAMPGNERINYTSVWYHAVEGDTAYHPCNRDIARYIQRDLAYALGNSGSLVSFDGTMSDYLVYPGRGFYVLRNIKIPAVLVECAFFTNEYEERRLTIDEFNQIEAWGIFKGIARYFQAGVPEIELLSDSIISIQRPTLILKVRDKSGIERESIIIKIDSTILPDGYFTLIPGGDAHLILFTPHFDLTDGRHTIEVILRNKNQNSSFPFRRNIYIVKQIGE